MSSFNCPFCSTVFAITRETHQSRHPSFNEDDCFTQYPNYEESALRIDFYKCPQCNKHIIYCEGRGDETKHVSVNILPRSLAKQFPEYIPEKIRNDYEEAYAIVNSSPKASATLSRRCLQGMIHDFWNIKLKNLNQEITALKSKLLDDDLWNAIDSLRELGNIGAHMEKDTDLIVDIDPDEATTLINLIELLMNEWYINREKRKQLIGKINLSNAEKQDLRKKTE
ncbi:DUF4145 domain-containing protein [Lacrimispora indolis]|uniref:DUF4145 domain-containing protein n=1 Tax=Lacrimispora indolis TaxID=69825 RepID=UPI00040BEB49|nr:DUF4145 domain-containing protein [[Clostridium] methoxybenzovorans]